MITIEAPITVNQFDATRFEAIEAEVRGLRTDVSEMKALLSEVLASRQAQLDELSKKLDDSSNHLKDVVALVTTQTKKE